MIGVASATPIDAFSKSINFNGILRRFFVIKESQRVTRQLIAYIALNRL